MFTTQLTSAADTDGITSFGFVRKLDTGDTEQDLVIEAKSVAVIYAIGDTVPASPQFFNTHSVHGPDTIKYVNFVSGLVGGSTPANLCNPNPIP